MRWRTWPDACHTSLPIASIFTLDTTEEIDVRIADDPQTPDNPPCGHLSHLVGYRALFVATANYTQAIKLFVCIAVPVYPQSVELLWGLRLHRY